MESLPPELLVSVICRFLTLRDNCRLCATSRRLYYEILPVIVADHRIEELIIKSDDSPFISPAFVSRYLSSTVIRIVLILDSISKELIDNLEAVVGVCQVLTSFEVLSTHRSYRHGLGPGSRIQLFRLSLLISNLNILHVTVDPRLKKFVLPRSVTSCSIDALYIRGLPGPVNQVLNPRPDLSFQNVVVLDVLLTCVALGELWKNFTFFPSVRDLTLRGDRY